MAQRISCYLMTGKMKSPSGVMVQQIACYLMTGKMKSPSGVSLYMFFPFKMRL
jgi:hypothetical protein